jgi:F-type H+/Na+-transporting ATPase subunit alpha
MAELLDFLDETFSLLDRTRSKANTVPSIEEVGRIRSVGGGIARISGLPGAKSEELLRFPGDVLGMVLNLDPGEIGAVLFSESEKLAAGGEVFRTRRVMDVPVGEALLGRVVDSAGRPLDNGGPVRAGKRRPIERDAPRILDRAPVSVPLQTGIKVVDALIPIGRGQRELILGDRQTGKTALAVDTIINQKDKDVLCVYCSIGQRSSSVAKLIGDLRTRGALEYTVVVIASGEEPAGMEFSAPYAATSIAEFFMEQGRDVLIVYDDLTRHARAYRELSLLLHRPPGREAYPGDIFYIHSRLLERATHLTDKLGGGSMTALPIVETEAQNISAYIPTNLISITDGQIYLSPDLFQKGLLPAVDVGKSVSRVGGKTQFPSYREVAGDLRLAYSQFTELEKFARFSTRLDQETREALDRGYRVREILKQPQYQPLPVAEQISVLLAVTEGILDDIPLESITAAELKIRGKVRELANVAARLEKGEKLGDREKAELLDAIKNAAGSLTGGADADA